MHEHWHANYDGIIPMADPLFIEPDIPCVVQPIYQRALPSSEKQREFQSVDVYVYIYTYYTYVATVIVLRFAIYWKPFFACSALQLAVA